MRTSQPGLSVRGFVMRKTVGLPETRRHDGAMRGIHGDEHPTAALRTHPGRERTLAALQQRYQWPAPDALPDYRTGERTFPTFESAPSGARPLNRVVDRGRKCSLSAGIGRKAADVASAPVDSPARPPSCRRVSGNPTVSALTNTAPDKPGWLVRIERDGKANRGRFRQSPLSTRKSSAPSDDPIAQRTDSSRPLSANAGHSSGRIRALPTAMLVFDKDDLSASIQEDAAFERGRYDLRAYRCPEWLSAVACRKMSRHSANQEVR